MPSLCLRNRLISTWSAAPADCAAPGLDWLITDAWLHLRLQRPTAWLMLLLSKLVIWLQTCLVNPIWTKLVLRDGRTEAGDSRRDVAASSGIQPQDLFCSVKLVGIPSRQHLKKIFSSEDRPVPKCPSLEGVTASSFFFFFFYHRSGSWMAAEIAGKTKPFTTEFNRSADPSASSNPQRLQVGPHTRPRLSRTTSRSGLQTECSVLPKTANLNPAEEFVGSAGTCRTCCSGQENNAG